MKINLLENGIYKKKNQNLDRVNDLFEIARWIEELGYNRLWLGEHHENDCAWRSPEVLISLLLGMTDKINIGSAGNLITLHNPLRLVQDYATLETIFSGRVDLGLAGGLAQPNVINALGYENISSETFNTNVEEIFRFFNHDFDINHSYSSILIPPYIKGFKPNIWVLATGTSKSNIGIKFDCNYAWSLFHLPEQQWVNGDAIKRYKDDFFKVHKKYPETAIAIAAACLQDSVQAEKTASQYLENYSHVYGGSPAYFHDVLGNLFQKYEGISEITICDVTETLEQKKESCFLLKEVVDSVS